jgi:hypothetical protein
MSITTGGDSTEQICKSYGLIEPPKGFIGRWLEKRKKKKSDKLDSIMEELKKL